MDEKKKVILIKGNNSKWFEQAIFILKDPGEQKNVPKNFVEEAEKIINGYMMRKYYANNNLSSVYSKTEPKMKTSVKKKRNKRRDRFLNISLILCCIFIGLILYYFS